MIWVSIFKVIIFIIIIIPKTISQELILFNESVPVADVNYNKLHPITGSYGNQRNEKYPALGMYSPTAYSLKSVKNGRGICNYICIPTDNKLVPGRQYSIDITLKIDEQYNGMPYYQDHFGLALTSELSENHWGLWAEDFIPFKKLNTEELVSISFEMRTLCTSKYLVIGVFQGSEMDEQYCNVRINSFELHSLKVLKSNNIESPFEYLCDAFNEKELDNKFAYSYDSFSIFFETGSSIINSSYSNVLDSIVLNYKETQGLVSLYSYTDKEGETSDNIKLGQARNKAVFDKLVTLGIDSSRIIRTNYGESEASVRIQSKDRRVEVDVNLGKLYQKYYTEAIKAASKGEYGIAHKKLFENWLRTVPPENAIFSIFDCWGENEKSRIFRKRLSTSIKSKFYKGYDLKFLLDSISVSKNLADGLFYLLETNMLPSSKANCRRSVDFFSINDLEQTVNDLYENYGFPTIAEVGIRANSTLPELVIKSNDLIFLKKYLPLVEVACTNGILQWKYFAILYDKISVIESGFQKYGTIINYNDKTEIELVSPLINVKNVNEYRRQVKLTPFSKDTEIRLSKSQKHVDIELVKVLNSIFQEDHRCRRQLLSIERQFGLDSPKYENQLNIMHEIDSKNLSVVKNILDSKGWFESDIVGSQGVKTLFLVIQHSDLESQLLYLPIVKQAFEKGHINGHELALLTDRIAIKQNKSQIYGSQISRDSTTGDYYVSPLIDPENVNIRRAKVGLIDIEDYIQKWGIIWDLDKHKMYWLESKN